MHLFLPVRDEKEIIGILVTFLNLFTVNNYKLLATFMFSLVQVFQSETFVFQT